MNTTPSSPSRSASTTPSDSPQIDGSARIPADGERALVLHGGGSAGNAWEIGVIAGLLDGGLDVTVPDLIVGTSAGSTAAAQITGASPTALLADILNAVAPQRPRPGAPGALGAPGAPGAQGSPGAPGDKRTAAVPQINHLERTDRIIAAATNAADMRRRMGAAALALDAEAEADADADSHSARWRATVAARLPGQLWPKQAVVITAVDARTGEPVVFDRESGVDLADAVAASTSSGLPYRIGDERYIDGGYRRNENADLATGFERVLVLSPFGGRTRHPLAWGMQLAAQIDELRASGSRVETILPDSDSLTAFGDDMMNPAARAPAARAGYNQGTVAAERLAEFWR